MTDSRGIAGLLYDRGTRLLSRVASRVLQEPRARELAARVVGAAQRGKRRFEKVEARVLHAAGLAARPDVEEVTRRMAGLKRKLREITKKVDSEEQTTARQRSR